MFAALFSPFGWTLLLAAHQQALQFRGVGVDKVDKLH